MGRGRRGNSNKGTSASTLQSSNDPSTISDVAPRPMAPSDSVTRPSALPPRKKQKREEYRHSMNTDESRSAELPKKKWFRQRAHANPFSDHRLSYPIGPDQMDWSKHYPAFVANPQPNDELEDPNNNRKKDLSDNPTSTASPKRLVKNVEIADIGCGYGGLLFALAPKFPETLILGLEIRTSITEFVDSKIRALRHQSTAATSTSPLPPTPQAAPAPPTPPQPDTAAPPVPAPGNYQNISTHRTNSMKFLPNFFARGALRAIFLCFPDPHFKARKHKARIVSATLCAEYAYALRPGGCVYTITDVEELGSWMRARFEAHPAFERVLVGLEEAGGAAGRVWREEREGGEYVVVDEGADEAEAVLAREEDALVRLMRSSTEEGKKVERYAGKKFVGVWRRVRDPAWPGEDDGEQP